MSDGMATNDNIEIPPLAFYKNSLRILRARRLNFEANQKTNEYTRQSDPEIDEIFTHVDELQKFVFYTSITKKALQTATNNVETLTNSVSGRNKALLSKISVLCEAIRSIKSPDNKVIYRERLESSAFLGEFWQKLQSKRATVKMPVAKQADPVILARAEKILRALNLTRAIKFGLIGWFFDDHKTFPQVQTFRTDCRRDLYLQDFENGWTLGFGEVNEKVFE